MDLINRLLGIDTPPDTVFRGADVSLRGPMAWWLAAPILLLLAAGAIYIYRLENASKVRKAIMALLRVGLICLAFLLLFRPILSVEFEGRRDANVVLLLDNSVSMKQQDRRLTEADKLRVALAEHLVPLKTIVDESPSQPNVPLSTSKDPTRVHMVRAVFAHAELKLLDSLAKKGPLTPLLFGAREHGLQEEAASKSFTDRLQASFKADETRTALADSIYDVLQRKEGDQPAAMVVITDGQDNTSKYTFIETALECARQKVPLFIYGVGTAEGGNLNLKEVLSPETIFSEDSLSVPVRWRAQGFKKGPVVVTMKLGGKQVASKEFKLESGENIREALTFIVPKVKAEERVDLTTEITVKGTEFKDSLTRSVRISDRKIKVLYIEHAPRFEYQFLQSSLIRDRRVDAQFILVGADPKVLAKGPPFIPSLPSTREKFFDAHYNVIILGDVAATYLGKEHLEWIKEFVQERGGLIVLAGRQHMPATYAGSPLAEVLPVEFTPQRFASLNSEARTLPYPPALTDIGQRLDMLSLSDNPQQNLDIWQHLPGFFWQYPITKLRPGAIALVVNPRARMDDQPMPVVATQFYGKGQVVYFGTDETWRWRYNADDKYFNRLWGQVIYQLGLPSLLGEASRRMEVTLEHGEAILDKPGSIFVRLQNKDYTPRKDLQVEATLQYLDAKPGQERSTKIVLNAVPGREGEYRGLLTHDKPGRFELDVRNPDPASFAFRVELPPRHELEESGLAEKALRDLAQLSGGKFYREEDLYHLADDVPSRKTAAFVRRQEIVLWNPLTLLLFVSIITAEWVMRKFANLS